MPSSLRLLLVSLPLALAAASFSPDASAASNPCGNIELTSISSCYVETSGGCKARCEPLSLVASCDGQCNAEIKTTCTGSCQGDCEAKCNVDPPKFNCQTQCTADCEARVNARCEAEEDKAGCRSYCASMCDTDCQSQCSAVPGQADCKAKCQGSCKGTCETDSNFDCTLDCSASLKGGCDVACDAPEGALFCDGQYIAVTDLPACVDYLLANFSVKVDVKASASASSNSSANCSVVEGPAAGLGWLGASFGLLAAALAGRRKRR